MAKMFYTLGEAAAKLGMSEDEVQKLSESGQLQEFRDGDRLVFKREQVDLLAGDEEGADEPVIPLADSGELEPISLSSSGSSFGADTGDEDPKEQTGVSIFDPDEAEDTDPSAETLVTGGLEGPGFGSDAGASGSGLAQLTLEPDDTSLGADLLDDLGGSQAGSGAGASAIGESGFGAGAGELFEPAGGAAQTEFTAPAAAPGAFAAEPYDGPGSGLVGGLAVGMIVVSLAAIGIVILSMTPGGASHLLANFTEQTLYIVGGGAFLLMAICALVGWVLLRRT